jgi:hypothetical protein
MTHIAPEDVDALENIDLSGLITNGSSADLITRHAGNEPMSAYAVRLPGTVIDRATTVARQRGLPTGTLLREWIIERLAVEEAKPEGQDAALWNAATAAALNAVPAIAQQTAETLRHST